MTVERGSTNDRLCAQFAVPALVAGTVDCALAAPKTDYSEL